LNSSVAQHGLDALVQVEAHDLAVLSFEQQVRLIGESAIVVGMHGAGE
jgi:capsular polysaccharide biosynthesis protein